MKSYSQDLRQRVVGAVDEGRPRTEIIHLFGVSRATIKRYLKHRRETGDLLPKAIPGRPARKGEVLDAELTPQLQVHRDATLQEHCQLWQATHGVQVSPASMSRAIHRLGWTRKKTLVASERDEAARARWRKQEKELESNRLVFVDECGSHIALTRLYARAPRGQRAVGQVPGKKREG